MIRMAIWFRNNLIPASIWSMACPAFFAVPLRSRFPLSPAIQSEADRPSGRRKPPRRLRALSGSPPAFRRARLISSTSRSGRASWRSPARCGLNPVSIVPALCVIHRTVALRQIVYSITARAMSRYCHDEPLTGAWVCLSLSPAI